MEKKRILELYELYADKIYDSAVSKSKSANMLSQKEEELNLILTDNQKAIYDEINELKEILNEDICKGVWEYAFSLGLSLRNESIDIIK